MPKARSRASSGPPRRTKPFTAGTSDFKGQSESYKDYRGLRDRIASEGKAVPKRQRSGPLNFTYKELQEMPSRMPSDYAGVRESRRKRRK